ncbi:MAG: hypothetical protein QXI12_05225 [Candidatus Methanomethyliaceae archaeon]
MSLVEKVRERISEMPGGLLKGKGLENIRERVRERLSGSTLLNIPSGQLLRGTNVQSLIKDVREKGALSILEDRFPRVKDIRETRLIKTITTTPSSPPPPPPKREDKTPIF